jgi:hypothetical protein
LTDQFDSPYSFFNTSFGHSFLKKFAGPEVIYVESRSMRKKQATPKLKGMGVACFYDEG